MVGGRIALVLDALKAFNVANTVQRFTSWGGGAKSASFNY